MKTAIVVGVGLTLIASAPASNAEEVTLEQAIEAWSFLEGDWSLTDPQGSEFEVSVHLAPTETAYVSESKQGLHVFGWDPKSRRLEIQSFMPDGTRGSSLFDQTSENLISGRGGELIAPDGTEQTLGRATFTVVDPDTYYFTLGEQKWLSRRKQSN